METELVQLAREAVAALQEANSTSLIEVLGVVVGFGQLGVIVWGLVRMGKASEERNRQLDQQGEVLRDIGQALRDQGQALRDQGQVLAELLRRSDTASPPPD